MPVITLTKPQKLTKAIQKAVRQTKIDCLDYGIKYKDIASITGVDPSAVSHQFNSGSITFSTYMAVQMLKAEKGENYEIEY